MALFKITIKLTVLWRDDSSHRYTNTRTHRCTYVNVANSLAHSCGKCFSAPQNGRKGRNYWANETKRNEECECGKKNRKRVENAIAMLSLDLKMQINVRFCHFLVLPRHEFVTGHVKYTPSPPPYKFFFSTLFLYPPQSGTIFVAGILSVTFKWDFYSVLATQMCEFLSRLGWNFKMGSHLSPFSSSFICSGSG